MPVRMMLATARVAHAIVDRTISNAERALLSKGKIQELERRRVDRIIRDLYDELYGRGKP